MQISNHALIRLNERCHLEPQEILITHVSLHSPNWIDNETLKFKREVTTDREPNDPLRLILPETLEEDVYKARLDAHNKVVGELERIG